MSLACSAVTPRRAPCGRPLGAADAEGRLGGRGDTGAGVAVEAPAVQGADELAVLNFTEGFEVGVTMRAAPLDDVVADLDVGLVDMVAAAACDFEFAHHFGLGALHPFARQ